MTANTASARDQCGDSAALQRAHDALVAGAGYLIARAAQPCVAGTIMPNVRLRRSGNCLNELDRFLSVMIGECARLAGIVEAGVPIDDAEDMPRRIDNARRLRRIEKHCGVETGATNRLLAIARIRNLACGDSLQRPGVWLERDMAVATAGAVAIVAHPTQAPEISDLALAVMAEFYVSIADRLLAFFAPG
ncbi:hypothetical protein [Novosphingobium sp.]|uniref:hypothetical protein n=1 Tax=Novosphingobium sp. TaxID=1874826 RepID=UPI003D0D258F